MKNIILLLILMFASCIFVSCIYHETVSTTDGEAVCVIDGHEYIKNITYGVGLYVYTHKGGCKACEQRNIFLIDSIVKANK